MKKALCICLLLMGVVINGQELLLHYNFDNNVEDLSGNNYNGTASGVTFVADRNGNPNSAVDLMVLTILLIYQI